MRHAADVCTALRVVLAPVLAWELGRARADVGWMPFAIYVAAAATDYVDGALARSADTASRRGRLFDHGADALLLFPAFLVLAAEWRVPWILPGAAMLAFTLYVLDGWRRAGSVAALELIGSRSGAVGGVLNYVIVGAATAAVALDHAAVDAAIYAAAFAVAAVNGAAVLERATGLFTTARGSLAARREPRASRSSP
ncbi:MAG: CDP-alcohol phosphatidyltransferase family protein [Deltaproteobacteria bacterium]|nr:CDP-alcohol phosphatidyltransferase family protein [Deltaproteobacteria bacterium]